MKNFPTNIEAARYVAHTHPLFQQEDEKPEDFVLRIVRAYDHAKTILRPVVSVPMNARNQGPDGGANDRNP